MAVNTDHELVSDPAQDDDLDSLFGGGDDDDYASLFTEDVGASEPLFELRESDSETTLLTPHSSPPEAANSSFQLTLPTPPTPKPHKGPELSLPLTLPQRPSPNEPLEFTFPTVPDPPGAALLLWDGHTSGDPVVSTESFTHTSLTSTPLTAASSIPPHSGAEIDALLNEMWGSFANEEVIVNTPSEPSNGDRPQQDDHTSLGADDTGLTLDQIPGFRYATVGTMRNLRLPCRIDESAEAAEVLVPYLTLSRETKVEDQYRGLELDSKAGKRLRKEVKEYLEESPFAVLGDRRGVDQLVIKKALNNAAFYMLVNEGWGAKWFGPNCETAQTRTLFWPVNSTLILVHFVRLLNRVIYNANQYRSQIRRHGGEDQRNTPASTPSRSSSVAPAPVFSAAAVYGTTGSTVTRLHTQPPNPLLDSLVTSAVNAKRKRSYSAVNPTYEVEVPDDAKLTYRVCVRDLADGSELGSPATYKHGSLPMSQGVYSYLKNLLEVAGHEPIFEILTPAGVKRIDNEVEWDGAVVSVYNRRRSGSQVEVDIWV
ncbi:hypothetical protein B0T16DRAFT_457976 [Cercophora newfieldiana]|uniref:Uncharacterized protein n=1 Tax=Cercophora newfieldiana TaxID=92897 RepID=A0AA39Y4Q6_9PEZI|nr:hypothetical protein B0T16DRAFT_457976 [Cercophora newfieldiana]